MPKKEPILIPNSGHLAQGKYHDAMDIAMAILKTLNSGKLEGQSGELGSHVWLSPPITNCARQDD